MAYVKTRGMVVREIAVGDYDKMLTVISADYGKISISAKGARRSGNRYSAGTQVLSCCDWVLYKGKNTYLLNSCELVTSFYQIREDLSLLTYAAHMLEMIQDVTGENQPAREPLTLLLHAMNALTIKGRNPELVSMVFALKLMQIMGYAPFLSGCCRCGTQKIEEISFSFDFCGFVCEKCGKELDNSIPVEKGTAKALIYVACADIKHVFTFDLSEEVLKNFSEIVARYINERLDRKYCKLSFLNEINNESALK